MKKYSYLIAYILLMAIPSVVLLLFVGKSMNLKALFIVVLAAFVIGGVFDIWATRQGKKDKFYLWEYNKKTTLGKRFMGMEIEDITLFLLLTPIFTVAAWEASKLVVAKYNIPTTPLVIGGVVTTAVLYSLTQKIASPKKKKRKKK